MLVSIIQKIEILPTHLTASVWCYSEMVYRKMPHIAGDMSLSAQEMSYSAHSLVMHVQDQEVAGEHLVRGRRGQVPSLCRLTAEFPRSFRQLDRPGRALFESLGKSTCLLEPQILIYEVEIMLSSMVTRIN